MPAIIDTLERGYEAWRQASVAKNFALASEILDNLYETQKRLPLNPHNLPAGPGCGYNKLGIHVINSLTEDVVQSGLPIFCAGGEYGKTKNAPGLVIGAKTTGYDAAFQYLQYPLHPEVAAVNFVADYLKAIGVDTHIKIWCGHNEFVPAGKHQMEWYARFEMARMRLMAEEGYRCVIGNFFTGGPEFWMWQYFLPAIQLASVYDAYLGLHEYSNVAMNWMFGDWQGNPEEDAGDVGWGTLRYRMLYRYALEPRGLTATPLVITECGVDAGVIPPAGWQGGFFKDLIPQWQQKLHIGERMYWDGVGHEGKEYCGLKWYNERLQEDDFVKAGFVFTYGNFGGQWYRADINDTVVKQKLLQYQADFPTERVYKSI